MPRATSAKSFGSKQPPASRKFQRLESAKVQSTNKNAVVITIDELQRMKQQCAFGKLFEEEDEEKRRKELQMKSQARVKNWPNTIEALRFKR
jgi:hypothetical protein